MGDSTKFVCITELNSIWRYKANFYDKQETIVIPVNSSIYHINGAKPHHSGYYFCKIKHKDISFYNWARLDVVTGTRGKRQGEM